MDRIDIHQQFKGFIDEGIKEEDLKNLFYLIPDSDDQDPYSLELATRCILEVGSLVDDAYPSLNRRDRLIKKYEIMSKLLQIKASNLSS